MSDYKLVPVEPTPEMLNAPLQGGRFENRLDLRPSIYRAMLAAAPDVQGEPVAYMFADDWGRTKIVLGKETAEHWAPPGETIEPLYTAPQPAVQQPCPESIREGAPYDDPAFSALCREHEVYGTPAAAQCAVFWRAGKRAAEQQPAPDVEGLVEALEQILGWRELRSGQEFPIERIEDIARNALAAHRKQGGEV